MPAFGLVEQSAVFPSSSSCGTMNEYATPYNPSMPFYTLTPNSGSPISSSAAVPYAYPAISSPEPGGSRVYYYDSGYSPYCYAPYGSDLSSSRDPHYSQDWYVGSSISPPSQSGWYSEDGHSMISYYPEVGSYENSGFYAYQPPPYHSQSHGDPFASSTIVTATPWENCPSLPSNTGAPVSADFFSPFQDSPTAGYSWCEREDTQNQKEGEDSSSMSSSEGHHVKFEEQETEGKATESLMELNQEHLIFEMDCSHAGKSRDSSHRSKQANNSWQGNVSPIVGMEHLHALSTCLNPEDIKSTKSSDGFDLKQENSSCQEKASKIAGMGFSRIKPNSDFKNFKTILSPKDFESDVDPAIGLIASCLDDMPKSKTYTSASESVCTSLDYLQRYSLQTLFGDFHTYENPANVCQLSKTEIPQICEHEFKGTAQDNGVVHADSNAESLAVDTNCRNHPPDVPPMIDVLCNNISPPQEMNSHFKRIEDFLANCSRDGYNTFLKTNSEALKSSSIQNAFSAATSSQFSPVLDILSSDCHPPIPTRIFPVLSETAFCYSSPWSVQGDLKSSAESVEGGLQSIPESVEGVLHSIPQTLKGDLRPGHLFHSSMKKTAPIISAKSINEAKNSESFEQVFRGTDAADSFSETMRPGNGLSSLSKEVVNSGNECHKLVHTMHNLSLLLLSGSSSSDKLGESEFQVIQSVICNLSECLVERMGLSTSVGTALKPEKSVISANIDKTLKGCSFVGEAVERTGSSHIPAEVVQSQVANVEEALNSLKLEISSLRRDLEMERLKNQKGEHEIGHGETISVNNNNGSCTEGILGIKRNYLDIRRNYLDRAVTQMLRQKSVGIPDLNMNPTLQTDVTSQNTQVPDIETEGDALEGRRYQIDACNPQDREILTESSDPSCSKLNTGWREIRSNSYDNLMERWGIISATQTSDMGELLSKEETMKSSPDNMPTSTVMHSTVNDELTISENVNLLKSTLCDSLPVVDSCVKETKEDHSEILSERHIEAEQLNPEHNHSILDDRSHPRSSVVEGVSAVEIPTYSRSAICFTDLGNVNGMHTSEENSSSESDSGWEYVKNDEGEHFYSFDEADFNFCK